MSDCDLCGIVDQIKAEKYELQELLKKREKQLLQVCEKYNALICNQRDQLLDIPKPCGNGATSN